MATQSNVEIIEGGSSGSLSLTGPTSGSTQSLLPLFRWTRFSEELTSYTLQITNRTTNGVADFTGTLAFQQTNISRNATAFQMTAALQPNTRYYWRIIAVNSNTSTSVIAANYPWNFITGITPGAFTLLSPDNNATIVTATPILVWSTSAQALTYQIQIDLESSFAEPLVYSTEITATNTSYLVPAIAVGFNGLQRGLTYYWRIRASNTGTGVGGITTASNSPFAFTIIDRPGSFILSTPAYNSTVDTLTPGFSWTGSTSVNTYSLSITYFSTTVFNTDGLTGTSFTMPSGILSNGLTYSWGVSAVNSVTVSAGDVPASNSPFLFTTDISPKAFNLSTPSSGSAVATLTPTLSWTTSSLATEYLLEVSTTSTFSANVTPFPAIVTTTYTIPAETFVDNQVYWWRVIASNSTGITRTANAPAPFRFTTDVIPRVFTLGGPVSSASVATLSPTFSWTASALANDYTLEISTVFSFTPSSEIILTFSSITTTSYTIPTPSSLIDNTSYFWRVTARSNQTSRETIAANAPFRFITNVIPRAFSLSQPTSGTTVSNITPSFTWTVSSLVTSYELQITTDTDFNFLSPIYSIPGITGITYRISEGVLANGQWYYWRVIARSDQTARFTIASNAPFRFRLDAAPRSFAMGTPLTGTTLSTVTPVLTWTASTLATAYTLQISTLYDFSSFVYNDNTITTTSFTLPDSVVSTGTYWWRIIASNVYTSTAASNAPLRFYVDVTPRSFTMGAPISGTTILTLNPVFTWTASTLATAYTLQISTLYDFSSVIYEDNTITTTSFTLPSDIVSTGAYWWRIIATNVYGYGATTASNAPFRFSVDVSPRSFTMGTPLSGTTLSTVTPVLSWTASTLATAYTLQISTLWDFSSLVYENNTITTTSFTLQSGILSSTQDYWWRVRAGNSYGTTLASNQPFRFYVDVIPRTFTLLTPIVGTIVTTLTPTLQWSSSTLATAYSVSIDDDISFTPPYTYETTGITTTSFTVPTNVLVMSTTYWWRIIATNEFGPTPASNNPFSFIPKTKPLNFSLVSPANSSVQTTLTPTLTWTSALYTLTYTLQIDSENTFSAPLVYENTSISSTATAFQITDGVITTGLTYYWRLIANNTEGPTYPTNTPFLFSTQVVPIAFSLSEPQNGAIIYTLTPLFTWISSAPNLTGYTLQIDNESTFASPLVYESTVPVNATTIPGSTLVGNTTYYWRVKATNASGITISNATFQFRAGAPPDTFNISSPISGGVVITLQPTLSWLASSNATGYTVEIDDESTFAAPPVHRATGISAGTLSYEVPAGAGLSTRNIYYWRVIAGNDFGSTTAANAPYIFETFVDTAPDAFNMVSPANESVVTSYTPTLTWQDTNGEVGYTLEVVTDTGYFTAGPYIYRTTAIAKNSTSFTLPIDAVPEQDRYYWRVIARGDTNNTIASDGFRNWRVTSDTSPWKSTSSDAVYLSDKRTGHTAVWTGTDMLVWGGEFISGTQTTYLNSGVRFNPTNNTWDYISETGAPSARSGHTAIWTGTYMIIWGGYNGTTYLNNGVMYNPATNTWTPMTLDFALSGRSDHIAVWDASLNQMIIWGGWNGSSYLDDGGRYAPPPSDSWLSTSPTSAPSGRRTHTGVWDSTDGRLFIWGGYAGSVVDNGKIYRASDNTWSGISDLSNRPSSRRGHTSIWAEGQMFVYGGDNASIVYYPVVAGPTITSNDGRYTPSPSENWVTFPATNCASARSRHSAVWTNSQMIIWGGKNASSCLNTGSRYTPFGNNWTTMTTSNAPSARERHTAVWTGTEMLVYGGVDGTSYPITGGRYSPSLDVWTSLPIMSNSPPVSREKHTMLFTTNASSPEVIIWGGWSGSQALRSGARYNPIDDNWSLLTQFSAPSVRVGHTSVWADPVTPTSLSRRMLIFGGYNPGTLEYTNTGGEYYPGLLGGSWSTITTTSAPSARAGHSAVWAYDAPDNINQMIVWGGWNGFDYYNDGARYNLSTWQSMTAIGVPTVRRNHTAIYATTITPTMMVVWGGITTGNVRLNTGSRYTPSSNIWSSVAAPPGGFASRDGHSAVWSGSEMIIWGGFDGSQYLNTGARYNPVSDTWQAITTTNAPAIRAYHNAVWADWAVTTTSRSGLLVWGGWSGSYLSTGGWYDPATDQWTAISTTGVPTARAYHSGVWMDFTRPDYNRRVREMFIWGGEINGGLTLSGSRYKPQ